ncbi:hypothetical protein KIJ00_05795 [Leuconostoc gelidum subsp. aenigmaticum]|uniref:DUF6287 domain-containing protein n=1 Tax=Leuconostoc gelidum TaxID=1244 RepID=UPI001CC3B0DF|nr:DUF6287 domain-containing protein [Leuconostoc gelidum]MBZ6008756.1 hypothetical protein [Leuconostoc gelidum subsp. aenigmaticum]
MSKKLTWLICGAVFLGLGGVSVYASVNHTPATNQDTKKAHQKTANSKRTIQSTSDTTSNKTVRSSSSIATKNNTGMNLTQIQAHDFSSVIGTWVNPTGDTFIFNKSGLLSRSHAGQTTPKEKVYLDKVKAEDGMLKAEIGADPLPTEGASILVPLYFIPKGVAFSGSSDKSQDRIYSGQQFGEQNIYTLQKEVSTTDTSAANSLSNVDKQALALLGLPSGFVSDYGDLSVNTILSGKSNVTSNAFDSAHVDVNNGKISDVTFSGVTIALDGAKNIVKLNNVPSNIDNTTYNQGYFTISGDMITYKNQGTRVSGAEQDALAETVGNKNLSSLYAQYKSNPKFEQIKKLITE